MKCKYCGIDLPASSASSSPAPKVFEYIVLGIRESLSFLYEGGICHPCRNRMYWGIVLPAIRKRALDEDYPIFASLARVVEGLFEVMACVPYPYIPGESIAIDVYTSNLPTFSGQYYIGCYPDGRVHVSHYDGMTRKYIGPLTFDELLSALRESREVNLF